MYRRPSKRVQLIRRIFTYVLMVVSIVGIVAVVLLFVLGYRLNSENGLEQGALLQFNTLPTGATVTIDGAVIGNTTPSKSTVLAGSHTVTMAKAGYDTWSKTVNTVAGTLTSLDYALLVPTKLTTQTIATYPTLAGELPSPDQKTIILQQNADQPTYILSDISGSTPRESTITLPAKDYTAPTDANAPNTFTLDSWDDNGRFVIVKHTYDTSKTEWIILDTQNVDNSKNITSLLSIDVSEVRFAGTNGTVLYALSDGTIRKLDMNALTISAALVSNVTSFDLYETNIITYNSTSAKGEPQTGLYQDGDAQSDVLKTGAIGDVMHIATARYYTDNYVAISDGNQVEILKGNYPHSAQDSTSLQPFATFQFSSTVQTMNFSPEGEYLTVQSGSNFESYDVEHTQTYASAVSATNPGMPLQWLVKAYLYTDADGTLSIREFDGTNIHSISTVATGYDATLTVDSHYLYTIGKSTNGSLSLQRTSLLTTN